MRPFPESPEDLWVGKAQRGNRHWRTLGLEDTRRSRQCPELEDESVSPFCSVRCAGTAELPIFVSVLRERFLRDKSKMSPTG